MSDYVLVHGGAHAGWCWEPTVPYLKQDPRVGMIAALDLVGHGSRLDEKPEDQITLEDYIRDITGAILQQDLNDVVLVGHSLAGAIIPQAAARVPDRVKRLVFVSAIIPPEGKTVLEAMQDIGVSADPGDSQEQFLRNMFCNDMDEAMARWLLDNLGPEPPAALTTPVSRKELTQSIPITYVLLTKDQLLPPEAQRQVLRNLEAPEVVELESGHDAMISHPQELARVLLGYA